MPSFFSNNKDNFYLCPFEITVLRPLLIANKMIVLASFSFSVHLLYLKDIPFHCSYVHAKVIGLALAVPISEELFYFSPNSCSFLGVNSKCEWGGCKHDQA